MSGVAIAMEALSISGATDRSISIIGGERGKKDDLADNQHVSAFSAAFIQETTGNLQAEKDDLEIKLDEATKKSEELQRDLDKTKERCENLQHENSKANRESDNLTSKLRDADKKSEQLKREKDLANRESDDLTSKLRDVEGERDKLKDESARLRKERDEAKDLIKRAYTLYQLARGGKYHWKSCHHIKDKPVNSISLDSILADKAFDSICTVCSRP